MIKQTDGTLVVLSTSRIDMKYTACKTILFICQTLRFKWKYGHVFLKWNDIKNYHN